MSIKEQIECFEQGKKDAIEAGTLPADLSDPVCRELIFVAADLESVARDNPRACRRAYLEGFAKAVRSSSEPPPSMARAHEPTLAEIAASGFHLPGGVAQ